jgi:endonuclease/exonuclease/phosphatase family metal-dependent hydrolase
MRIPDGPIPFAVVTWNLHDGAGDLDHFVDELESGRLLGQRPVDYVLLLQEAVDGELDAVTAEHKLSTFHVPVFAGSSRRGNAILSTRPLESPHALDLPEERQHRVAAAARIALGGHTLFLVSAHLENRLDLLRGGPFGDRARDRQAEALVEALPPAAPGIVGGDMNTMLGPEEPALRRLRERFADTPREPSRPTFRGRLVLDHLFFDLPDGWRATRDVVPDRYGSDHHPVVGVIEVRGGGSYVGAGFSRPIHLGHLKVAPTYYSRLIRIEAAIAVRLTRSAFADVPKTATSSDTLGPKFNPTPADGSQRSRRR